MQSVPLFLLILCFFCGTTFTSPPDTLRQVNLLYRHGDRSPTYVYPKDIHQVPDTWPDGLGWLTKIGEMQQYELGKYIKARYDGFLNTSYYNHSEILIQSSGVERCLMSAYSNLAGLYPPGKAQEWNEDIPWQPIPVQTTPEATDSKLSENAPCARYDQLKQEVLNSPEIKKEEQENKEFYDMVEASTGIDKITIDDVWTVADTLTCEKAHNLTWNDWVTEPVWEKMQQLKTLSFDLLYAKPEMAKLKGGPLLKEIIGNMQSGLIPGGNFPKIYMYSAHDTTVASLLSAMKAFDCHTPIYRALVMVELHEINDDYVVKIFYRNDTSKEPYELTPTGCTTPCTLDNFIAVTKDRVPEDWAEECKAHSLSSSTNLSPASWIALAIGICLLGTIAIALLIMIIRLKRKRSAVYSKL